MTQSADGPEAYPQPPHAPVQADEQADEAGSSDGDQPADDHRDDADVQEPDAAPSAGVQHPSFDDVEEDPWGQQPFAGDFATPAPPWYGQSGHDSLKRVPADSDYQDQTVGPYGPGSDGAEGYTPASFGQSQGDAGNSFEGTVEQQPQPPWSEPPQSQVEQEPQPGSQWPGQEPWPGSQMPQVPPPWPGPQPRQEQPSWAGQESWSQQLGQRAEPGPQQGSAEAGAPRGHEAGSPPGQEPHEAPGPTAPWRQQAPGYGPQPGHEQAPGYGASPGPETAGVSGPAVPPWEQQAPGYRAMPGHEQEAGQVPALGQEAPGPAVPWEQEAPGHAVPGQEQTPGYEAAPGQEAPAGYGASPGWEAPPWQERTPGYGAPSQEQESGYEASPGWEAPAGYGASPGQEAPPGYGVSPGQEAPPGYGGSPSSGQVGQRPEVVNPFLAQSNAIPRRGMRRAVYRATFGAVNLGPSEEERARRARRERVARPLHGSWRVVVMSIKGGVGKTTTAAMLGRTLAEWRGDRVVALDTNPDMGTLGDRLVGSTDVTVRGLLAHEARAPIQQVAEVNRFTNLAGRLHVLANEQDPAVSEDFTGPEYQQTVNILERFYNVIIADCGTGVLRPWVRDMLALANTLVVVAEPKGDAATRAAGTLDWIAQHGFHDLVSRSVAVINYRSPTPKSLDVDALTSFFAQRCRAVCKIRYDEHLDLGVQIQYDPIPDAPTEAYVADPTKEDYLELAATVADEFR